MLRTVQWLAFALHALAALGLYAAMWRCRAERFTQTTVRPEVLDWQPWVDAGAPGRLGAEACNSSLACYREGQPWADDAPEPGGRWNPFVLGTAFEWLSACFSAYYLFGERAPRSAYTLAILAGYALLVGWWAARGWGLLEPLLVLAAFLGSALFLREWAQLSSEAVGSVRLVGEDNPVYIQGRVWRVPRLRAGGDEREAQAAERLARLELRLRVCLRYLEYSATSALLYLAVLMLFVVEPPTWAAVLGAGGMVACNMYGAALHLLHLELVEGKGLASHGDTWWQAYRVIDPLDVPYALDYNAAMRAGAPWGPMRFLCAATGLGCWRDHWAAWAHMLQAAWLGLAVALAIVVYLGAGVLTTPGLPWVVVAVLWQLLVLYSSFGLVATAIYLHEPWWPRLELALALLDIGAKVPVAVIACVSFVAMPGGSC